MSLILLGSLFFSQAFAATSWLALVDGKSFSDGGYEYCDTILSIDAIPEEDWLRTTRAVICGSGSDVSRRVSQSIWSCVSAERKCYLVSKKDRNDVVLDFWGNGFPKNAPGKLRITEFDGSGVEALKTELFYAQ